MRYVFGLLNTLASGVVAFGAFIIGAIACDEACFDDVGASWTYRETAWQWDAIMLLGFLQLVVAAVLYLFVISRRRRMCFALVGLQTVSAGALVLLLAGAGWDYSDNALLAAAPVLFGALAVWVTRFPAATSAP